MTAFGLILNLMALTETCATRRRFTLLILVAGYALALLLAWIMLFGWLSFEAFD